MLFHGNEGQNYIVQKKNYAWMLFLGQSKSVCKDLAIEQFQVW